MKRNLEHIKRGFVLAALLALLLALLTISKARAEEQNNGVPGDWLSRYMGPRPAGVGGAFVALIGDPTGVVWNPAGLSFMTQNAVHLESSRYYESTSINGLSFAVPGQRFPSVGLTILNLRSGDFEKTNELNEPLGEFNQSDMAFLFSASKNITHRFALGANLKIVRQAVDDFDAAGVGIDLGVMFNVVPSLRLGASVLNVGGPSINMRTMDETYPSEFRGGAAFMFFNGRGLVAAELNHRSGPGTSFHGGTEFWVHRTLALRVGYAGTNPSGGFSYRVSPDFRFDYAATDQELGMIHRLGLSYAFGGFYASSEAVPNVFSPLGQQSVTKFNLKANTKGDANSWALEIVDKSGQVVRRFSGKGVPPAHIMWDGKDETGLPLPDGTYTYQLVVIDEYGDELMAHLRTVEITTEGPKGTVPVITETATKQ
ncbi:MAG: PorV/PorQ family protein [Candidatus Latescibacterota bacterium]|nr:MAG: PorV/PorQ family protein [Candidatus Latescibacterota bacterium]